MPNIRIPEGFSLDEIERSDYLNEPPTVCPVLRQTEEKYRVRHTPAVEPERSDIPLGPPGASQG